MRMMARGREDDTEEAIARRLSLYEEQTAPLLDWFAERGLLATGRRSGRGGPGVLPSHGGHRRPHGLGVRLDHEAIAGWSTPVRPVALSTGLHQGHHGDPARSPCFQEVQLCRSPKKMPSSSKGPLPNRFRTPCSGSSSRTVTKCLRTSAGRCECITSASFLAIASR